MPQPISWSFADFADDRERPDGGNSHRQDFRKFPRVKFWQAAARVAGVRPRSYNVSTYSRTFVMKTRIVRIGNSQGIRIPKPLLEQTGLRGEVEMIAHDDSLIIRPARRAREGWTAAFEKMARRGDDALLDDASPSLSAWDEHDWEWR